MRPFRSWRCLIIVIAAFGVGCNSLLASIAESASTATPSASSADLAITVSDASHGYSIALPPEWEACATTEHSRVYCAPQSKPEATGFPTLYVSAIPDHFSNDDGTIYNFLPEESLRRLIDLPIGGTLATAEPNPEHSSFTRLPDAHLAAATWAVIENTRVWDGGPDTKDRRWIVVHGDMTFEIGAYYETQAELINAEAVLATFAFTPQITRWEDVGARAYL